ncbi:MAG: 3-oxoadipate--succinyl-CoA transferase subunit B [Deltaproteobacteria bacterium]|nr:3-oxoadipate--succinyl-CoA transferase subunit B [Deltaproteobacteria bacterium]
MAAEVSYNTAELVCISSARLLEDGKVVFAGAGLPLLAAILAQKTHAKGLTILFEGGVIGPFVEPGKLPPSTNEQRCAAHANMVLSTTDVLLLQQRGYVDYGFLGGAQVDQYGNINSSFIGDWSKVIVAMHHEKRRLVKKVDFITSPGYLNGGDSRKQAGLIAGGALKVVTHLAILGFDDRKGVMCLEGLQPGATVEKVQENTGFPLMVKAELYEASPPTEQELSILHVLDPERRYTTPRGE